jgi:hypothetical protein
MVNIIPVILIHIISFSHFGLRGSHGFHMPVIHFFSTLLFECSVCASVCMRHLNQVNKCYDAFEWWPSEKCFHKALIKRRPFNRNNLLITRFVVFTIVICTRFIRKRCKPLFINHGSSKWVLVRGRIWRQRGQAG